MTCKDCVHYGVCGFTSITSKSVEKDCRGFKNKADFVEVKHGEWEKYRVTDGYVYLCSVCGYRTLVDFEGAFLHHNYCTKCGAKMDGERRCDDGNR